MKPIKTVLLVEDNAGDARLLREMLADEGSHETELTVVGSMGEAETYLAGHAVEEAEFLRARHCDEAQGYFFSRPLRPHEFARLLRVGIPPSPAVSHPGLAKFGASLRIDTGYGESEPRDERAL